MKRIQNLWSHEEYILSLASFFTLVDLGYNDFERLRALLTPNQVNIVDRDQHISRIERDIRLIEESLRCFTSAMPYRRITKLLLFSLIEYIITCLNDFLA